MVMNSRHMSRFRLLLMGACTAAVLTACSPDVSSEGTPGASAPSAAASPSTSALPATPTPAPFRYPLTGLGSQTEMATRPYMVMVENASQARPQSGLQQADIVFEILAEGEITRFVSVFQSQPAETIGPVRSIRPYFVELGEMLDAVIVHAGWSQDAMNLLQSHKLNHLDQVYGDHAFYWRASDRKAPHNLYTSTAKIAEGAEARKFRKEWKQKGLLFANQSPSPAAASTGGTPARHVQIPYIHGYIVSYDYDAAQGYYLRTMDGKPHVDKETGSQLHTRNLLVLEARHTVLDKEGRRSVDVSGPGKGTLIQEGQALSVTWQQKDGMLRVYADSKEIPLLPGNTWVQVVPGGTALQME
jgi:hypothetical protein